MVYFFSLLFFLPWPPWKQGIEFSETWEEKDFSLQEAAENWKVNCFICLSTPLSNSASVVWGRKTNLCMYVYICGYIYISCYSNSTSQWLSELLSHHTYLPILTNLNAAAINSSRRKIGSTFFLNRWESNDYISIVFYFKVCIEVMWYNFSGVQF